MSNCKKPNKLYLMAPILVIALLFSFPFASFAQQHTKIGFELREFLKITDPAELVPILVEGDPTEIHEKANQFGLQINLNLGDLFSLELPADQVEGFSKLNGVKKIEFSSQPGVLLNDTMLINTNSDSVIQMHAPLSFPLTGKGVLLGFIDSGIEINHHDFKDSLGRTRILYIWDQKVLYNPSQKPGNYSYGVEWDSASINSGICTHDDQASEFGHGTMVTGAAASNGNASGQFAGLAPEANIIAVATNLNRPNWLQSIAESVDYIYKKADSLGMPCVINASVGTYRGSHDGKDIAARMIDLLLKQKPGRSLVCAAGNAGHLKFHLQQSPQNDTTFTWFKNNPSMFSGLGGLYYEIWSDTADFNAVEFAFAADKEQNGNFEFRGRTAFNSVAGKLNQVSKDSIISLTGNLLAYVEYYIEESQGRYKMEVALINPDSSQYLYRLESRGTGKLDVWTGYSLQRASETFSGTFPSPSQFPDILKYQDIDSLQNIVSSFTCLPSVITVGNYINRNTYVAVNGITQNMNAIPGKMSEQSSLGPNRNGLQKPDISSCGDFMLSSGRIATMNQLIQTEPSKISQDSLHMRNGGTSMASPTVAGMVAQYLQLCKNASYLDIKNNLLAAAKLDNYTPHGNSIKWGKGKADAFQFLSGSAFQLSLNLPSSQFCGLDSVLLGTNGTYSSYKWNTSDTTASIYVSQSGSYFAEVENTSGCKARSNEIFLQLDSLPTKPRIRRINDSLSITGSGNYQWYFNSNAISGANLPHYKAQLSGAYYCQLTDTSSLCFVNSDTIQVFVTSLKENRAAEFAVYPNPGSGQFNLELPNAIKGAKIEVLSFDGKLVYSKTILAEKQHISLNLSLLTKGSYLIRLRSDKGEYHKLLLIQ